MSATNMSRQQMQSINALLGDTKTVLSTSEIARMKEISLPEEVREANRVAAQKAAKAATIAKSEERKQKMLELEAQRKLAVPPSEIEKQKLAEKVAMLSAADRQMAEELDDVKKMNQVR